MQFYTSFFLSSQDYKQKGDLFIVAVICHVNIFLCIGIGSTNTLEAIVVFVVVHNSRLIWMLCICNSKRNVSLMYLNTIVLYRKYTFVSIHVT